jgi:hypothetical protein
VAHVEVHDYFPIDDLYVYGLKKIFHMSTPILLLGMLNVVSTAFHIAQQAGPIYLDCPSHTGCLDLARIGQTPKRSSAERREKLGLLCCEPLRLSDFLLHSAPF